MSETSLEAALARLDNAVARLESAPPPPPPPAPAPSLPPGMAPASGIAQAFAALDERHGLLRLRIQETIDRLDAMIGAEA